ncbi:MAG TPA: ATP-binding protein [Planctomycetaceae bacterium]|nr:ATP-binding protein [Planctomycetaceae bacterium]
MDTSIHESQALMRQLLQIAEQRLQRPCAPFDLEWCLQTALQKAAARPQHFGFGDDLPFREWSCGSDGHNLMIGFAQYEVRTPDRRIPVLMALYPKVIGKQLTTQSLWICPQDEYARLYRFLRRSAAHDPEVPPPLMADADRQRLWDNTIGFLLKGKRAWEEFQVPLRRGVMLLGEPGNGKTMAARWLRGQANQHGLEWKTISGEEYDRARTSGELTPLLSLDEPGLVFLDDFDRGLENREQVGTTQDHSALLSALDGMDTPQGVVYVFTSNLTPSQLDPAIRRPGRIDAFIPFARPNAELRRKFLTDYWPEPIRAAIPIADAAASTDGLSFAEMDEVKKLMVLRHIDEGVWDWPHAWAEFQTRTNAGPKKPPIGFAAAMLARPVVSSESTAVPPATKLAAQ